MNSSIKSVAKIFLPLHRNQSSNAQLVVLTNECECVTIFKKYHRSSNKSPGAYLQKSIFGWGLIEGRLIQKLIIFSRVDLKMTNYSLSTMLKNDKKAIYHRGRSNNLETHFSFLILPSGEGGDAL